MQTSNPALMRSVFERQAKNTADPMSIAGTVNKTLICTFLLIASASFVWYKAIFAGSFMAQPFMIGGGIGGFILALVTIFKPSFAPITAPLYCIVEGFLIGGISFIMEAQFPGIAIQAFALTISALSLLLLAYKAGWIKVTNKFRSGLIIAIGGIALLYMVTIVLGMFGIRLPYIHDSGPIGIGISLVIVSIAALSLVLDFEFIRQGANMHIPKYMEWYGAFSLMVTLIWLYLEILNLLGKINNRK